MSHNRTKKVGIAAAVILALMLIVTLAIDPVATYVANRQLAQAPGIAGHVEAVHVSLIGLRAELDDFNLQVLRGKESLPVVAIKSVSVDAAGSQLIRGVVQVSAHIDEPVVTVWRTLIEDADPDEAKKKAEEKAPAPSVSESLRKITPFKVDSFKITNGVVRYRDYSVDPNVQLVVNDLNVQVRNLTNRTSLKDKMFADAALQARPIGGSLQVNLKFDPLARDPTFKLDAQLRGMPMVRLNDALRAYTKFEVDAGDAAMFAEYAARDGHFEGYVKPAFTEVKVHPWKGGLEGKPFEKFWRSVVGGIVDLFKSNPEEQVATKVPMKGRFDDPDIGVATAVVRLLKNGFVEALMQKLDYTVSIAGVPTD